MLEIFRPLNLLFLGAHAWFPYRLSLRWVFGREVGAQFSHDAPIRFSGVEAGPEEFCVVEAHADGVADEFDGGDWVAVDF